MELTQLQQWFATVKQGERQVGFITGEAGIGKTTLVEAFIAQVDDDAHAWVGYGQCINQYGAGEAYLPLLAALGRLCRSPHHGAQFIDMLRQHAPSWMLQMPALLSAAACAELRQRSSGTTRDRMLRELAEAMELLTVERPLVLILEDLHWSDVSTLDWLAYVARRPEVARLLVIGTYRPMEAMVRSHPLRTVTRELRLHGKCMELALDYLSEANVAAYLDQRYGGQPLPQRFAQLIHQRTDGNPLFMVAVVDAMIRQGILHKSVAGWEAPGGLMAMAVEIPESLRQLIEQQLEDIDPTDRAMLDAASVVGAEFSAAAVAAGLGMSIEEVEARFEALARRAQFVRTSGTVEWPDGTVAGCYSFIHTLYQEVLYRHVSGGRLVRLHGQIGTRVEAGYGVRAQEVAAELAMHFERGRDTRRAVNYLHYAALNAQLLSSYQESINHLSKGLELLTTLADDSERTELELTLLTVLGPALVTTKGAAAPEVEQLYTRARTLCDQGHVSLPLLRRVIAGLHNFYRNRAQLGVVCELGEHRLRLAKQMQDDRGFIGAHHGLGVDLSHRGEFIPAHVHLKRVLELYDPQHHNVLIFQGPRDDSAVSRFHMAWALWALGYPDQALRKSHASLARAQELPHAYTRVSALLGTAFHHQLRRDVRIVQARAEAAIALASEQGFPSSLAIGMILRGWALSVQGDNGEGREQLHQGLTAYRETGAELARTAYLAFLAETCGRDGQTAEGLAVLSEAFDQVQATDERFYEAELYRLQGKLLLQDGQRRKAAEAEMSLRQALEIAHRQQAKAWELRVAMSLGRLWWQQERREEARKLLTPLYNGFSEGFDTADVQEAKALLQELSVADSPFVPSRNKRTVKSIKSHPVESHLKA